MAPPLLVRALACWLAMGGGTRRRVMADPNFRQASKTTEACPRCDMIFSMLETGPSGERVQHIEMVERGEQGFIADVIPSFNLVIVHANNVWCCCTSVHYAGEPKSGTTLMYHWAHGALVHTCNFLNKWFGATACQLSTGRPRGLFKTPADVSIIFDPRLGGDDAKCHCGGVDRVEISVTDTLKHDLPVDSRCAWQHPVGLAKHKLGCLSADGGAAKSYIDIWLCMKQAACKIDDNRHQFVVMRDPRAGAVSTFFHKQKHPSSQRLNFVVGYIYTLDEFTLAIAPLLCQWVTIRYFLFSAMLGPKSTLFWYDDALLDAHKWHSDWLAAVGVHLPERVVEEMADAALREDFDFKTNGRNDHPGVTEEVKQAQVHRPTWKELLRPETLVELDVITRQWLPPEVLVRLNLTE